MEEEEQPQTITTQQALKSWYDFWRERATDPRRTDFTMEQSTLLRIMEYLQEQEQRIAALENNVELLRRHTPGL